MTLRRFVSITLALMLVLCMSASAHTTLIGSYTLDTYYSVNPNLLTNTYAVRDHKTGLCTLHSADGTALTSGPYIHMSASGSMFEVATESGINTLGLIDSTGKLVVPMKYGDVDYVSDRWQVGVTLTTATADNYDYQSFSNDDFYLVSGYDFYFDGTFVGTLERTAYKHAYAMGAYLCLADREWNYTFYDSSLTPSPYAARHSDSDEYEATSNGVFHKGSGQQAFTASCTLTSADVKQDIYEVDGRFLDLQGNELFALDPKYDYVNDVKGDYIRVSNDSKYGLIDRSGREIIPCEHDYLSCENTYFEGGYQIAVKDGKVGFYNTNGEITCEFKYSKDAVYSHFCSPATYLTDLDGSTILLSGAVGELPERYAKAALSDVNGCPLIAVSNASEQAGIVDLYGQTVIPMDGTYSSVYDFKISADGTLVIAYNNDGFYDVYLFEHSAPAVPAPAASAPAAETAEDGSWTCACGQTGSGNFCANCGSARPADKLVCANCGFEPEGEAKFCSECGTAF